MPGLGMITLDTANPQTLAAWWAERLGAEVVLDADGWFIMIDVPGWTTNLGFQYVEAPTPGKNRLHLDLTWEEGQEREAGIAAWIAAGATHLGLRGEEDFRWDTFTDPDGNEFCLAAGH
ncbi:VOC family protein [Brevibacterium album]|uniref:VOC family protein n=1 Tax=Brevibacterium album TaxID=417948 RepID=UPI00048C9F4D|nr:VOC family protein [Brevibacterium album]